MSSRSVNRLAQEKSPYLLQHKNNPIEWFPWGTEAFEKAKTTNRPIFLSVGYSTCHWCHVMERESFENEQIAKYLNENFVSIKVDREERPDVDKLYMSFVVAVSGHGGWPMSVFLTPELTPITGGTYFPPDDSRGMLGFPSILKMIAKEWEKDRNGIEKQGRNIIKILQTATERGDVKPSEEIIEDVYSHKKKTFDERLGGFGRAPKFPKASDLDFLIACGALDKSSDRSKDSIRMLDKTLQAMNRGGIHDHIGKGFHRYSVDAEWHVPHFEKMLYDQGQLLAVYADFHRLTGRKSKEYEATVRDIAQYMEENLSHSEGGFYSAEDADSFPDDKADKKMEGAFCVWERDEIDMILNGRKCGGQSLFDVFCDYFDVEEGGNVARSSDPHGELTNKNVLRRLHSDEELISKEVSEEELLSGMEEAKELLREVRKRRPSPHLDSKMVTSWQGLAISGFAKASQALNEHILLTRAEKCIDFVRKYLTDEHGSLLRAVYRDDQGNIVRRNDTSYAFSDDYAFFIQGLLDVYTLNGDDQLITWAGKLQDEMTLKYWNYDANNGFFISEECSDSGIAVRMIEDQDGAEPCATSIAASNLIRLYDILENEKYRVLAENCFKGASERLNKVALALPKLAVAHHRWNVGSITMVIVGDKSSDFVKQTCQLMNQKFLWNLSVVYASSPDDTAAQGSSHNGMANGPSPAVYICKNFTCEMAMRTIVEVEAGIAKLA